MKDRSYIKMITYLLVISVLFSIIPTFTPATAINDAAETPSKIAADTDTQLYKPEPDCQVHKYVDETVFASNNHTARLHGEETLSSYVFANHDGTTTVYYMDEEVKFIDADGSVVEKDISLSATSEGYTTTRNDINLTLPTDPANGIRLTYNGKYISLTPQGGVLKHAAQVNDNALCYPKYFSSGASLVYTPTLSGVKEDIVLERYTGVNSFTFRLNTNGLNIYQANGRYFLAESKLSTCRFELGDVVAFDARGKFSLGKMEVSTIMPGQAYQITITADKNFLTDSNTVYPVSIDPTITVSDNTHGAGAIEDTTIYSGVPTANGNWTYLHCGYYDNTYKVARTLVRLNGMIQDPIYKPLHADQITSVKFHIREATGSAGQTINLYANTSATWNESTVTWNSASIALSSVYASASAVSNSDTVFDITSLAKAWKTGVQSGTKGFVLKSTNESSVDKAFYSSEFGTTNYRPYVEATYSTNTPANIADGVYRIISKSAGLPIGTSGHIANRTNVVTKTTESLYAGQFFQYWKIKHLGSNYYSIRPMYKQDMALEVATWNADIYNIGYEDTLESVPVYARWKIETSPNGYVLKKNGSSSEVLMTETNGTTAGINIKVGTYSANSSSCHFELTPISPPVPGSLMLFSTSSNYLYVSNFASVIPAVSTPLGGTKTMEQIGFIPSVCDAENPSQYVAWSSSNESVATIDRDTGTVTTKARGKTVITAKRAINDTLYQVRFELCVTETIYVVNYYDKTIQTDTATINLMDDAVSFLNTVYRDEFCLNFVMGGTPSMYEYAPINICPHSDLYPCGTDCLNDYNFRHHKNLDLVSEHLLQNSENNHIYVLWSDSKSEIYCHGENDFECSTFSVGTYAVTPNYDNAITVLQFDSLTRSQPLAFMCITLAHEVAHTFDMPDVYSPQHDGAMGYQCLMEYHQSGSLSNFRIAINNGSAPFCQSCAATLAELILAGN